MTYSTAKFEVATSNSLGGDTFTRNVKDGRAHERRTDLDTKLIYPFFRKKKVVISIVINNDHAFSLGRCGPLQVMLGC